MNGEAKTSPPSPPPEQRQRSRTASGAAFFAILAGLELATTLFLSAGRRIPAWHDAFQYFSLQYYFLNAAVTTGQIPRWMPYMTQGTVATWWYAIQAGLLQNVLLYLAPLFRHVNLLYPFQLGMLVDELLLLTGLWLLARRWLAPAASCFTCMCVVGTAIWVDQPWYNFHFYYAVPLVLYFGHRFFDTSLWRYFLAAGNLLAVQTLGNLPYFIPVTSLVVAAYFAFYLATNPETVRPFLRRLRWNWRAAAAVLLVVATFVMAFLLVRVGVQDIVNYNLGRNPDGTTQITGFLNYAGNTDLSKWEECILGVPTCLDYTLYCGLLAVPLVGLGLISLPRRMWHLPLLAALLLSIAAATPVAALAYRLWPMMKYYRHLALISPFVKLFGCVVAGRGFDCVFGVARPHPSLHRLWRLLCAAAAIVVVFIGWMLLSLHADVTTSRQQILALVDSLFLPTSPIAANDGPRQRRLLITIIMAAGATVVLLLASLWKSPNRRRLIAAALFLTAVDVYGFRLDYLLERTRPLGDAISLTWPQPMPFLRRRTIGLEGVPRLEQLGGVTDISGPGESYWSTNSFVFADEMGSTFRADHWLWPLDRLMKAYWHQSLDNSDEPPKGLAPHQFLAFPLTHPAVKKVIGIDEDRVQFFTTAHEVPSDDAAAHWLTHPDFTGDSVVLSGNPSAAKDGQPSRADVTADDRLHLGYQIPQFDADDVEFSVNNDRPAPAWMLYCQTWNPSWRATVNGAPAVIRRADLAYQAISIPPGKSIVSFHFRLPLLDWLDAILALNSLVWLVVLVVLMIAIFRGRLPAAPTEAPPAP